MLHGRGHERARIARLLQDARAGSGGALIVSGEAGTGKSTLLTDAAATAEDMRVLRTQGIESEAPLAFAALERLLRPVMPLAERLPAPQARALRVVFGAESGEGSDRFLVFLAALSLLAEAAEKTPVLAVVDDAHWLDDASAAALLFIARRLQLERIALLFGAREGDVRAFDPGDDLPLLRLTGLDLDAVTSLLRDQTGAQVSAEVGAELMASTGGNPLALVELPRVLSADQLTGRSRLPGRLPVTGRIERVFLDRARRLSEAAQRLVLVAATDDSGRVSTISAAAARLDVGADALAEVEASGLVRVVDGRLQLRHPLVRSAVYAAATSIDRRRAHAALAEVLTRPQDADRRAWHRAASVDEPDAAVVADLDAAAARAEQRGGYEAAAAAWERAAELSAEEGERARRLYGAARGAWLSGQAGRARSLADAARDVATDPLLRADVIRLRARIEWNTGSVKLGHRMVLEGARDVAPHDLDRAREMAMFAAALAAFGGDSGIGINPTAYAGLPGENPSMRQRCFADLLIGLKRVVDGDWARATGALRQAFDVGERLQLDDQDLLPNLGIAALHLGDVEAADTYHQRLLTRARDTGAIVMVLYSLTRLGFSDIPTGRWASAGGRQTEALRLGEATGQPVLAAAPLSWLLLLSAYRGDDAYDNQLGEVESVQETQPMGILEVLLRDITRWAKGVHASPRSPAAFHHLAQITHHIIRRMAAIDRIEAAVHADQVETAGLWIGDLETFAAATGQAWAGASAAHGRAVLAAAAGSVDADADFEEALRLHTGSGRVFDRARTLLVYGEHLRRTRRRVAARDHLRAALEVFEDLRAAPWAERATQELRASGETARKRDTSAPADLTPQELQVAQLVQRGMSNREVAAQLFVSPRTVDFHLRNVFAKTGVTSRLELTQVTLP